MKLVPTLFYNMLVLLLWTLCFSLSNSWDVRCPSKVTSPIDAKVLLLIMNVIINWVNIRLIPIDQLTS